MVKVSIVLPVFNQEKNIKHIVAGYEKIAKKLDLEIIFVEDTGSKDKTRQELKRAAKQHKFVRYLFTKQRGYGISIYNGLNVAKGEYIGWSHSDMQCNPKDVLRAYELLMQQKNPKKAYIKGDRYGRPFVDQTLTHGMSVLETLYTGTILYDINAQPNLFHKSLLKRVKEAPHDFSFDLYLLYTAKRLGWKITRFNVLFGPRMYGKSSWNTGFTARWKLIKRTLSFTWKLDVELEKIGLKRPGVFKKYFGLAKELAQTQLGSFCIIGGLSTIINYGLFFTLYKYMSLHYLPSAAAGYVSGVLFSFAFNKRITFKSAGKTHHELLRYFMVYGVSLLLGLGLLRTLVSFGINPLLANVFSIILSTIRV
jgi:putative flippase GtrA